MTETNGEELAGGCLCGAVRFRARDVEVHHHACHCKTCRRWTGSPLLAAKTGSVQFDQDGTLKVYDSSEWAERGFCSDCGSSLFYRLKGADDYYVCVGAFDADDAFTLAAEVFIDSKPDGYAFAGERPRLTGEELFAQANADA